MEETKKQKIIKLKSELFDLQIKMATDRGAYEDKLKELNRLLIKGESHGN